MSPGKSMGGYLTKKIFIYLTKKIILNINLISVGSLGNRFSGIKSKQYRGALVYGRK
jgi:hypothetical protein